LKQKPRKVHAVRGPCSRKKLLEAGIPCPEIYGDPALLLPKFHDPEVHKTHKVGIIPHFVDKDSDCLKAYKHMDGVRLIDVENPNPLQFIEHVKSCEHILSSSLHGLIVADAYNVPSVWIKMSDDILGGAFKFIDYFKSVGREDEAPILVSDISDVFEFARNRKSYCLDIDLQKLQDACPFKLEPKRNM